MPASLKRMFGSPFGSLKRNKNRISSPSARSKLNDNQSSIGTYSPVSITTTGTTARDQQSKEEAEESLNGAFFESDIRDQEYDDDYDDFRSTAMASTSLDASSNEDNDDNNGPGCGVDNDNDNVNDNDNDNDDGSIVEDDDFKTTVMAARSTESRDASTGTDDHHRGDEHSETRLDYLPTADDKEEKLIHNNEIDENENVHTRFSGGGVGNADDNEDDDTDEHQESPINSVIFEKQIETGSQDSGTTHRIGSTSQLSPLLSPGSGSDERDGFIFDDYRSTISGLTEATTNYHYHRGETKRMSIPPSPTHSTNTNNIAVTKKMEAFLKTENEAIRQLLSEVDSGDDESTVVAEECIRGANEAERMAREMEREMELIVHGINENSSTENASCMDTTTPRANDQHQHQSQQDTPESNQFLTDILSVIHPSSNASVDHHDDNENKSLVSDFSFSQTSNSHLYRSPRSSRRDLFRKPGRLYKLKKKIEKKKFNRKKIRRCLKYVLRALFLAFVLSSTAFVVNWQWNFSDQDFSNATKITIVQLKRHTPLIIIDQKRREEIMALVTTTTRATQSYVGAQLESATTRLVTIFPTIQIDHAKNRMIEGLRETSSFVVNEATHYTPILAHQTKIHVINGLRATQAFALGQLDYSYAWNNLFETKLFSQGFEATNQYVKDRLEYAFTDRAAREQQLNEEERLQKIMEAAAAAAAKEAAEKQQQLLAQTLFAGACAFVGSVATNYLWSAF
jgi:hypothetical protein